MSGEKCPLCGGAITHFADWNSGEYGESEKRHQECTDCDLPYPLWQKIREMQATIDRLERERDDAREAANWLFRFVDESEYTHFDADDLMGLEQYGEWLGVK